MTVRPEPPKFSLQNQFTPTTNKAGHKSVRKLGSKGLSAKLPVNLQEWDRDHPTDIPENRGALSCLPLLAKGIFFYWPRFAAALPSRTCTQAGPLRRRKQLEAPQRALRSQSKTNRAIFPFHSLASLP